MSGFHLARLSEVIGGELRDQPFSPRFCVTMVLNLKHLS